MKHGKKLIGLLFVVLLLAACGASNATQPDTAATAARWETESDASSESAMPPTDEQSAAGGAAANDVPSEGGEGSPPAQADLNRKIIYTGYIEIRTADARALKDQIVALAGRFGGFRGESNIHVSPQQPGFFEGTVQIRVNSQNFEPAMAALRELGDEVITETSDASDVTSQYVDVEARINNLKRTETEIQALLAESRSRGAKTEEILRIYQELTSIREQIEVYQGQLNVLADQTSLATITVSLVPPQPGEPVIPLVNEEWSFMRIVREATASLVTSMQGLIESLTKFVIAVLPQLLIWAVVLYVLFRLFRWIAGKMVGTAPRPQTIPPLRDGATVVPAPRPAPTPVQPPVERQDG